MIEEVAQSLYRVELPLPHNPLQSINSYFLKSPERNLIIDSGMNVPECRETLLQSIRKIDLDLNKTDFFITHFHVDHLELSTFIAPETSTLYLNPVESILINNPNGWQVFHGFYLSYGFPENELRKMEDNHLTKGYQSGQYRTNFTQITEATVLKYGNYTFQCINTPGHSPGHVCLYEPAQKILVSGDHILFDITPNITGWPHTENVLQEYLANLDKVYPLDVKLVLPGHRNIMNNHRNRISVLQKHHRERANEILDTLDSQSRNAYEIAPLVSWDVTYKSWEQFPVPQKFFAVGEVIAHLKYLEGEGTIKSFKQDGIIRFSR
jgi:glyoxylase-like metal-dependent hydrolase (beta-lactamase superfamily II)